MTAKNAHTLISFNEHCVILIEVKINTMKNANNPLSRDYNEKLKKVSDMGYKYKCYKLQLVYKQAK